jgi:Ca2+-dependent lipid-binding protein
MSLNTYRALLKVDVLAAKDLRDADGIGKSDPYVKITFEKDDACPREAKTHVLDESLNPVWNTSFYFLVNDECKSFKAQIFDKDKFTADDSLGYCNILRRDPDERGQAHTEWYYLEKGKGGTLQITTQEIDLSGGFEQVVETNKERIKAEKKSKSRETVFLLAVKLENAQGLKKADFFGKSDPYCTFKFSKEDDGDQVIPKELKTKTIMNTLNPVWDEYFFFIAPWSLKHFRVNIWDYDKASQDDLIGHVNVAMDEEFGIVNTKELAVEKKGKLALKYAKIPIKGVFSASQ